MISFSAPSLCPHPEVCGSCTWSHFPYKQQIVEKQTQLESALTTVGYSQPIIVHPSPKTEHYRNRMDFVINFEGAVGLRQKGKWWRVIDNHPCFLADEAIDRIFYQVRDWVLSSGLTFFDRKQHHGLLRYAVVRATRLGETMITLITSQPANDEERTQLLSALKDLSTKTQVTTLVWGENSSVSDVSFAEQIYIITGLGVIHEQIGQTRYAISPNAFFQTNSWGAETLQAEVLQLVGDVSQSTVVDLFCGTGFFTIPLSQKAQRVVGIELVEEAVQDAKSNAQLNSSSAEFFALPVEQCNWWQYAPDVLLVDPPRSGLHRTTVDQILEHQPQTLIYVSCNYKNFVGDCALLQSQYELTQVFGVDMFPHTPHVELVTQFRRK